jgi:hypothetical protein
MWEALGIAPHCFYETQPAWARSLIVGIDSGDIGVPGIPRYPVDADHGGICKPKQREDYRCGYLVAVVREVLGAIVVPRSCPRIRRISWVEGTSCNASSRRSRLMARQRLRQSTAWEGLVSLIMRSKRCAGSPSRKEDWALRSAH